MRHVLVGIGDPFLVHPACEKEDQGDEGYREEAFCQVADEVELQRWRRNVARQDQPNTLHFQHLDQAKEVPLTSLGLKTARCARNPIEMTSVTRKAGRAVAKGIARSATRVLDYGQYREHRRYR